MEQTKPSNRWQELKRRPVLKGMIGSYLMVLAVPLVLCLLLYWQSYRTIRAENEAMYTSTLKQVGIDMDAYLTEVQQILNQMLLDTTLQRAARIGPDTDPADQLKLVQAMNELTRLHLSHPNAANLFLVLNRTNRVLSTVSGTMEQELFCQTYYPSERFTTQQFQEYMRQPHHQWDMILLDCDNGKSYLLFSRSSFGQSGGTADATAVVAVDLALLNERLSQFTWDPQLNFYAVHPDGTVVCHTGTDVPLDIAPEDLQPFEGFRRTASGGRACSMMVRGSASSAWQYILLVSDSLLAQSARRIQVYTLLGLLVCMAVSLALSMRLAHRSYHPLMRLMGYFSAQKDAAPPQLANEYAQLEAYVQHFFEKRSQEQHALWNSQQSLQKYRLYTLLERPGRADLAGTMGGGLLPQANAYLVVVFTIPQLQEPAQEPIGFDLLQFAVANVFEEVAGAHFPAAVTNTGEGVAAVLGLKDTAAPLPAQLEEDIQFTQQTILDHFHLVVSAAAGAAHRELSGIHYSYLEALEAASYLNVGDPSDFVAYTDIQDAQSSYALSLEEERRLIALLNAGAGQEAQALLEQLFAEQPMQSAGVLRCLAYDVVSALNKGAGLAGVGGVSVGELAELAHCPPEELPARLQRQAALLCAKVRQQAQEATPNGQLCDKMRAYIAENYGSPDLNISMVGAHFDRTPAYLSAIFKKETGMSLLGYITQVRLDAVKALLLQGQPIARIAEQTGFRDSGALIRVFKRSTGMTPGQYRETKGAGLHGESLQQDTQNEG